MSVRKTDIKNERLMLKIRKGCYVMAKKQNVIGGKAAAEQAAAMQERKKRFAIIGGTVGGLLVIAAVTLLIIFMQPKDNGFSDAEQLYAGKKIAYTKQEYDTDKAAIDNGGKAESDPAKKARKANQRVLHKLYERYNPGGGGSNDPANPEEDPDKDVDAWVQGLLDQVRITEEFIATDYGNADKEYSIILQDGSVHDMKPVLLEDIVQIEKYCKTGNCLDMKFFPTWKPEQCAKGLKASAWYRMCFENGLIADYADKDFSYYNKWFQCGHPNFTKVYSVILNIEDGKIGDTPYNLSGTIVTDNGTYTVTSALTKYTSGYKYEYYDIRQGS